MSSGLRSVRIGIHSYKNFFWRTHFKYNTEQNSLYVVKIYIKIQTSRCQGARLLGSKTNTQENDGSIPIFCFLFLIVPVKLYYIKYKSGPTERINLWSFKIYKSSLKFANLAQVISTFLVQDRCYILLFHIVLEYFLDFSQLSLCNCWVSWKILKNQHN